VKMRVCAFTKDLIIFFVAPSWIPQPMGGVKMFFSG